MDVDNELTCEWTASCSTNPSNSLSCGGGQATRFRPRKENRLLVSNESEEDKNDRLKTNKSKYWWHC